MWASLKAPRNAEPRWPDVPNATRWAGSVGSGVVSWYAASSASTSTRAEGSTGLPACWLMAIGPPFDDRFGAFDILRRLRPSASATPDAHGHGRMPAVALA